MTTPTKVKSNLLVKQAGILAATIFVAILEKSILPLLILLPILKQEELVRATSQKITLVERQCAVIPEQIAHLNTEFNASQAANNQLAIQVRTQRTRQNLAVAKIQLLHRKNRVLKASLQTALTNKVPTTVEPQTEVTPKPKKARRGIFIDSANIECAARQLNAKVDYRQLKAALTAKNETVDARIYIGKNPNSQPQRRFFKSLSELGYTLVTKPVVFQQGKPKANVDVDLAIDLIKLANNYTTIVLVSGDGDYLKAVKELQSQGIKVIVAAWRFHTNHLLRQAADEYINLAELQDTICLPSSDNQIAA
jgi:uncharacterized LabA/DUF88 family protein